MQKSLVGGATRLLVAVGLVLIAAGGYLSYERPASAGPAVGFAITNVNDPITEHRGDTITVEARDASNARDTNYTGTVRFTSTDPDAILPPDYTFVAGDGGVKSFDIEWATPGEQTLTVTDTADNAITGSQPNITVRSDAPTKVAFGNVNDPITEERSDSIVVEVLNAHNERSLQYGGTLHFTSSDPAAELPADITFQPDFNGATTIEVTWHTPGEQSLTATDTANPSITGTKTNITVRSDAPVRFMFQNVNDPITEERSDSIVVEVLNAHDERSLQYGGTVHFTSSDPAAELPADITFQPDYNGATTIEVTWHTPGEQSLTATDTANPSITGTKTNITVRSDAPVKFSLQNVNDPIATGATDSFVVEALNAFDERSLQYRGTARFTSSDPGATLPADYQYQADDFGAHAFEVTWANPGEQTLTVRDSANPSMTGSKANITVTGQAVTSTTSSTSTTSTTSTSTTSTSTTSTSTTSTTSTSTTSTTSTTVPTSTSSTSSTSTTSTTAPTTTSTTASTTTTTAAPTTTTTAAPTTTTSSSTTSTSTTSTSQPTTQPTQPTQPPDTVPPTTSTTAPVNREQSASRPVSSSPQTVRSCGFQPGTESALFLNDQPAGFDTAGTDGCAAQTLRIGSGTTASAAGFRLIGVIGGRQVFAQTNNQQRPNVSIDGRTYAANYGTNFLVNSGTGANGAPWRVRTTFTIPRPGSGGGSLPVTGQDADKLALAALLMIANGWILVATGRQMNRRRALLG